MFPPKPNDDPREWLDGLWSSLQRAGHHFGNEADIQPTEEGVEMRAQMNETLPTAMKGPVLDYMKKYARACGWRVSVRFEKRYALVRASRASSNASKNSNANASGSSK